MDPQAEISFRCDRPEIGWLVLDSELVARMILRKAAIRVGMPASPGTGLQVCDQLFQFDAASAHFDPDEDSTGRRADEQVETIRHGMMLEPTWLQADMPWEPTPLENKPRGGGKLADIFTQEPRRFRRQDPVGLLWRALFVRRTQQGALNSSALIDLKQTFL